MNVYLYKLVTVKQMPQVLIYCAQMTHDQFIFVFHLTTVNLRDIEIFNKNIIIDNKFIINDIIYKKNCHLLKHNKKTI